ncbi:DNA-directed DNA polymerase II small subunit [Pyrococcus yayanosii]|uniref:DNA polymerase II small subunit n=1 Tax=Pyrococcus yayanosii (strain CH1 / JCM 16557) TaxID=529709 RepID=F8AH54_PYRYC|nr:DNA-directed DNA polymerase II small subunit [Pyrococcus yayanosii]AEH25284.1 DNA polymerase II small subunit [Pyrococcus yayanosii CH1]
MGDEFVRALMANRYLITPPAYFLLVGHYGKSFTLAELVKFAKSKGTFIIDEGIAREFLAWKGLPMEVGPSEVDKEESTPEPESTVEKVGVAEEAGNDVISMEPAEIQQDISASSSASQTSISTGESLQEEEFNGLSVHEEAMNGEISEGESFVSTGTDAEENRVNCEDYDILRIYEPEEIKKEAREYSKYEDVLIELNPDFEFRSRVIKPKYEVKFDVRKVKLRPPKVKNGNGKEGEVIVEAYASLFRSRLKKLRKILRENPDVRDVVDIGKLSYVRAEEEVTIIGLVNSKKETNRGLIFEVEDATGTVKVFLPKDSEDYRDAFKVLPDAVVAFRGFYSKKGIFFANRFYLPDVPIYRKQKPPIEEKVYAILISDIHIGSREFCEKAFLRFLEWLNGYVSSKEEEEIVSRVKYLIIAGDVVDGVGIYPGQYNDLIIPDIFDQYEALANLLANVPEHITMFIGPGNHDAARPAIPQPEFYKEYAKPLYELKNAVIISNPAIINLHGRDFLIAHGRGIEDVVSFVPGLSHHKPALPMVELLKMRHLAPTFGGKVPIAPDPEDLLVIEEVPDLVHMGHVHVYDAIVYRGVQLVNSATWQAQTEFQKMVNIVPTPAKVPVVDVESARVVKVLDFSRWC